MADILAPGVSYPSTLSLYPLAEFLAAKPVDYHMHTTRTDGTASSDQMAKAAASSGIHEVLFSEHVRHTSTYYPDFVEEIRQLPANGLKIHVGIETKALDVDGNLDCSPEIASLCDAIVGSVHSPSPDKDGVAQSWSQLDSEAAEEHEFNLAMAIVIKSRAHILGHPMGMVITRFGLKPLNRLNELALACRDSGKAFELNTRYCANPPEWIDIVRRAGCKVSFGSDAHRTEDVGSAWHLFTELARGKK